MIDRLLVLRTCAADGTSHNGFRWPLEIGAVVEAPDWDADDQRDCGGGLHGLPWGLGDGSLLSWGVDARWLVVEVDLSGGCVGSKNKCRFRRGAVLHVGDRYSAARHIVSEGAVGAVVGALVTAGDGGTATAGYRGTATAGDEGTATAGDEGTATAGDEGTATAGYGGTATAGDGGTATAGDGGTATAGDGGTATAGYRGTATAGYGGTATAGYGGTATAGDGGTATAGDGGTIALRWWDAVVGRYRIVAADVGEGGIEPGVAYCVRGGKLVRA